MSNPVTGSQIEIYYDNELVSYGQGFKVSKRIDYQTVRTLGQIYPRAFVISFVMVQGGFTVADHSDLKSLNKVLDQIEASRASSAPSNRPFSIRPAEGSSDAPSYTVQDCQITQMDSEGSIDGSLMTTTFTFVGKKMIAS